MIQTIFLKVEYEIIHRNTKNTNNDHNSSVILKIKPLNEEDGTVDENEVFYSESNWTTASNDTNKMNIGNNSVSWNLKSNNDPFNYYTFNNIDNVTDNTKTSLPELSYQDRKNHFILNEQRLGSTKLTIDGNEHIAQVIFK